MVMTFPITCKLFDQLNWTTCAKFVAICALSPYIHCHQVFTLFFLELVRSGRSFLLLNRFFFLDFFRTSCILVNVSPPTCHQQLRLCQHRRHPHLLLLPPRAKLLSEDINIAAAVFISIYLLSATQAEVDWINRRQTGVTFAWESITMLLSCLYISYTTCYWRQ